MGKKALTFSELEQIKLLFASGYTHNAIAKEIDRDPKTVKKALERPGIMQDVEVIRLDLADRFETLTNRLLDSIGEADIDKINAYQRIVGAGISTDKMRLLRNENNPHADITINIQQNMDAMRKIELELRELENKADVEGDEVVSIENEKAPGIDS